VAVVRSRGGRRPDAITRLVAVAAGGALGTLARYGANWALPGSTVAFPWATFLVNVVGSFLLGAILTVVVERWSPTRYVRPFAAIGFCGGFTTFSTFAVEIVQRGQHGRIALAAVYLAASLFAGLAAALAGIAVARGRVLAPEISPGIPDPDDLGVLFTLDDDDDEPVGT
jgi:CrcB protein